MIKLWIKFIFITKKRTYATKKQMDGDDIMIL